MTMELFESIFSGGQNLKKGELSATFLDLLGRSKNPAYVCMYLLPRKFGLSVGVVHHFLLSLAMKY